MSIFDRLLPDDERPESLRRWRLTHSAMDLYTLVVLTFLVIPCMFVGLPRLGQIAWADDVKRERSADIQAAVAPLARAQEAQQKTLDGVVTLLKKQNDLELLKTVLIAKKEECAAKRDGRSAEYWSDQVIKLRNQYREQTGQSPDVPTSCSEL